MTQHRVFNLQPYANRREGESYVVITPTPTELEVVTAAWSYDGAGSRCIWCIETDDFWIIETTTARRSCKTLLETGWPGWSPGCPATACITLD